MTKIYRLKTWTGPGSESRTLSFAECQATQGVPQLPTTPVVQAESDVVAVGSHKMIATRLFKFTKNMALFI